MRPHATAMPASAAYFAPGLHHASGARLDGSVTNDYLNVAIGKLCVAISTACVEDGHRLPRLANRLSLELALAYLGGRIDRVLKWRRRRVSGLGAREMRDARDAQTGAVTDHWGSDQHFEIHHPFPSCRPWPRTPLAVPRHEKIPPARMSAPSVDPAYRIANPQNHEVFGALHLIDRPVATLLGQ